MCGRRALNSDRAHSRSTRQEFWIGAQGDERPEVTGRPSATVRGIVLADLAVRLVEPIERGQRHRRLLFETVRRENVDHVVGEFFEVRALLSGSLLRASSQRPEGQPAQGESFRRGPGAPWRQRHRRVPADSRIASRRTGLRRTRPRHHRSRQPRSELEKPCPQRNLSTGSPGRKTFTSYRELAGCAYTGVVLSSEYADPDDQLQQQHEHRCDDRQDRNGKPRADRPPKT